MAFLCTCNCFMSILLPTITHYYTCVKVFFFFDMFGVLGSRYYHALKGVWYIYDWDTGSLILT